MQNQWLRNANNTQFLKRYVVHTVYFLQYSKYIYYVQYQYLRDVSGYLKRIEMLLSPSCHSEVMNTCPFQLVKLPTCIQEHLRNYKILIKLLCMKTLIGLDVTNMSQKFLFTTFILRTRTFGSLLTRHTLFFLCCPPPPPPPGLFLQHTFVNLNWWKSNKAALLWQDERPVRTLGLSAQ